MRDSTEKGISETGKQRWTLSHVLEKHKLEGKVERRGSALLIQRSSYTQRMRVSQHSENNTAKLRFILSKTKVRCLYFISAPKIKKH